MLLPAVKLKESSSQSLNVSFFISLFFFPIWPKRSNTPEEDDRNHICGSLFLESAVNQTLVYGLLTLSQGGSYYWGIPVYVDTKSFKGYWYIRTQSSSLVLSSPIPSWVQLECLPWEWELIQYLHYWECIFLLMKYSYQPVLSQKLIYLVLLVLRESKGQKCTL